MLSVFREEGFLKQCFVKCRLKTGGAHGADRVFGIVVEAEVDDRRNEASGIHQRQPVGAQHVAPAHAFGGFEAEQQVGRSGRDLRRKYAPAEAQVRRDDAAALRHSGDFGLLDVVTESNRRLGQNFSRRHDALTTGADDEDIGYVRH